MLEAREVTTQKKPGRRKELSDDAKATSVRLEPDAVEYLRYAAYLEGSGATVASLMRDIIDQWIEAHRAAHGAEKPKPPAPRRKQ